MGRTLGESTRHLPDLFTILGGIHLVLVLKGYMCLFFTCRENMDGQESSLVLTKEEKATFTTWQLKRDVHMETPS